MARADEIAVAGPMPSHSEYLDEEALVEGAATESQDHLLAISQPGSISEAVTEVLVDRGNTEVVVKTGKLVAREEPVRP